MKNLYAILAVPPRATLEQIRTAYRSLARKTHPDRHQGGEGEFIALHQAYSILSSADKRAAYDAERLTWMRQIGAVACDHCGTANRITHRPAANEVVRCASCKTALPLTLGEMRTAQQQVLVREATRLVDAIGPDLAELAADAVKSGIGHIRQRFGLGKTERSPKSKG